MTSKMHLAAGRYRLIHPVGEGGMAVVYRAVDELLGRPVAVKLLRPQFAGDREFVERFRREAQAAASLSHPNVVQIFDVGRDNGSHYIVMELIDGKSLKQVLRERGRLDPTAAVAVALSVAKALAHAHRHGLVHRDIKPHNILITTEGLVKVADFGIARAASATSLTDSGTVLGSVHYFSPEQARGQSIGLSSDLYSLGIVLFEMLTGHVPFSADSPIAVAIKHVQDPVPSLPAERSDIPPALARSVQHLLAKEPDRRPASAEEAYDELRRAVPEAEDFPLLDLVKPGRKAPDPSPAQPGRAKPSSDGLPASQVAEGDGAPTQVVSWRGATDVPAPDPATMAPVERAGRGRRRLLPWLFVAAFLGGLVWAASQFSDLLFPKEVLVPDIVGRTQAEARELLRQQGLGYDVDQMVFSDSAPEGTVVRQDPESGRRVREGRKVWATVSLGPQRVMVPDVVGTPLQEARLQLTREGFELGDVTYGYAPTRPANTVLAQDPQPGTELERGRPVNLVVSRGEQPITQVMVPDLSGLDLDQARQQLEAVGLLLGQTWGAYSADFPEGTIMDQEPPPGQQVSEDSAVDVVYSQGPMPSQARPDAGSTPGTGDSVATSPDAGARPPVGPGPDQDDLSPPVTQQAHRQDVSTSGEAARSVRTAEVGIQVPPGPDKEVVIVVVDDFGPREAFRRRVAGGSFVSERVTGRGESARFLVYVGGAMVEESPFPPEVP